MKMDKLQSTFDLKRKYFDAGNTRSYEFRIAALLCRKRFLDQYFR